MDMGGSGVPSATSAQMAPFHSKVNPLILLTSVQSSGKFYSMVSQSTTDSAY
jgi:hypothetical protein